MFKNSQWIYEVKDVAKRTVLSVRSSGYYNTMYNQDFEIMEINWVLIKPKLNIIQLSKK